MPLVLTVQTGDITTKEPALRTFEIAVERPSTTVTFAFESVRATLEREAWPALLDQVRQGDLVKRHSVQLLQPPLGNPDLFALVKAIRSTPTYQLFLAGIDIAEQLDLLSDTPANGVLRRFDGLEDWIPSHTGRGGLFFLPGSLLDSRDESALHDLLKNNKICLAELTEAGPLARRYYLPYATPIGFLFPVNGSTRDLWEEVRDYYYALRPSL